MISTKGDLESVQSKFVLQDQFIDGQNKSLIESNRHTYETQCQLKTSIAALEAAKSEISQLKDRLKQHETTPQVDHGEVERLKADLSQKNNEIHKLSQELKDKSSSGVESDELLSAKAEVEKKLAQKEQEIDSLRGKMVCFEVAEEHLQKLREELTAKCRRLEDLETELREVKKSIRTPETTPEVILVPAQGESLKQLPEGLELKVKELQTLLDETKQKLGQKMMDNNDLKEKLAEAKESLSQLQNSQSSQSNAAMTSLKKETSQLQAKLEGLNQEIEDARNELSISESSNRDLRTLKNTLQQQLDQRTKEKSDLNSQLIDKDRQLISTKDEIVDIK